MALRNTSSGILEISSCIRSFSSWVVRGDGAQYTTLLRWRHFTVSMNLEFLAKFTLGGNVAITVLIKWFYGESTLCTSPRLHFKLNAIHGHASWQHHSPSLLMLKIEKHHCQIAQFTGGPCISLNCNYMRHFITHYHHLLQQGHYTSSMYTICQLWLHS